MSEARVYLAGSGLQRTKVYVDDELSECGNGREVALTAAGAERAHRGPLEWLKAGCEGIVILRPKLCYPYLKNARRVICSNEK